MAAQGDLVDHGAVEGTGCWIRRTFRLFHRGSSIRVTKRPQNLQLLKGCIGSLVWIWIEFVNFDRCLVQILNISIRENLDSDNIWKFG